MEIEDTRPLSEYTTDELKRKLIEVRARRVPKGTRNKTKGIRKARRDRVESSLVDSIIKGTLEGDSDGVDATIKSYKEMKDGGI